MTLKNFLFVIGLVQRHVAEFLIVGLYQPVKTELWYQAWPGIYPFLVYTHFEYYLCQSPFCRCLQVGLAHNPKASYGHSILHYHPRPIPRFRVDSVNLQFNVHGPQTHFRKSIQKISKKQMMTKNVHEYTTQNIPCSFQISNGQCLCSID